MEGGRGFTTRCHFKVGPVLAYVKKGRQQPEASICSQVLKGLTKAIIVDIGNAYRRHLGKALSLVRVFLFSQDSNQSISIVWFLSLVLYFGSHWWARGTLTERVGFCINPRGEGNSLLAISMPLSSFCPPFPPHHCLPTPLTSKEHRSQR